MIPMMNNPAIQLLNMVRSGGNPMQLLQQMAGRNPQAAQVIQMISGKNPQQLRTMAENMCRERGTSIERVAQQLGISLPEATRQTRT